MQESFWYWQNWKSSSKRIFVVLFSLLSVSIILLIGFITYNETGILYYRFDPLIRSVQLPTDTLSTALGDFSLHDRFELVYQKAVGELAPVPAWVHHMAYTFFMIFMCYALAVASRLERLYYYASMAGLIFFLAMLKLDLLQFAGYAGPWLFLISTLFFVLPGYYFFAFRSKTKVIYRFLVYLVMAGVYSILLILFCPSGDPWFHIVSYGLIWMMIGVLLLAFIVGFDIVHMFFVMFTYSPSQSTRFRDWQLIGLSSLYLLNVLLLYLKVTSIYVLDVVYLNAFILLAISVVAGIWGVWHRRGLNMGKMQYSSLHVHWYMAWSIFSILVLVYLHYAGHDALLEVVEDVISYTHLGLGTLYLLYIIRNFGGLIKENRPAWRVAYEPRRWPFIMVRAAGLVVVVAMFLRSNYYSYFQSVSGYYNSLGDYHLSIGESEIAKSFYQSGALFDKRNHKSNFSLATMANANKNLDETKMYLERAVTKSGTPYAYLNLASLHAAQDNTFQEHFTLRSGLDKYPDHPVLLLNYGLSYLSLGIVDSALFHLDKASENKITEEYAKNNLLALALEKGFLKEAEDLSEEAKSKNDATIANKALLLSNKRVDFIEKEIKDHRIESSYLLNIAHRSTIISDTSALWRWNTLKKADTSGLINNLLIEISAPLMIKSGRPLDALETLGSEENFGSGEVKPMLAYLGRYFVQSKSYARAIDFLGDTRLQYHPSSTWLLFLTLGQMQGVFDTTLLETASYIDGEENKKQIASINVALASSTGGENRSALLDIINGFSAFSKEGPRATYAFLESNALSQDQKILFSKDLIDIAMQRGAYAWAEQLIKWQKIQTKYSNPKVKSELSFIKNNSFTTSENFKEKVFYDLMLKDDVNEIKRQFRELQKSNPYYLPAYALIAKKVAESGNPEAGYDFLVEGLRIDPANVLLHQQAALISLELGLYSYAEHSIEILKRRMPLTDYNQFYQRFEEKKLLMEKIRSNW